MSKIVYFWMCLLCLLILLGGMAYGAMAQDPDCDNKCRSRYVFTACQPSGGFNYYYITGNETTCYYCSAASQYLCNPQSMDSPNKMCKFTANDIELNLESIGSQYCACAASPPLTQFVEGISANTVINSMMVTQWTCQ